MSETQLSFNLELLQIVRDNLGLIATASVFLVWITMHYITSMVASRAAERTRREIAAYIAEGTMTPEQGERLLKAKVRSKQD
ncbi:MAG: hypothetical protein AAGI30_09720 [Planctomycetota bacterium]